MASGEMRSATVLIDVGGARGACDSGSGGGSGVVVVLVVLPNSAMVIL